MNRNISGQGRMLRSFALIVIIAFGILTIVGSGGGGGGDGDGDGGDRAPTIPGSVRYDVDFGGFMFTLGDVSMETRIGLHGTYRRGTRSYTLDASTEGLQTGWDATITPEDGLPTLGDDGLVRVQIEETLRFDYGKPPTAGVLRLGFIDPVIIRVNNNIDGSGNPGVDLEYLSDTSSFTWAELEALLIDGDGAESYQLAASVAWFLMRTIFDHVQTLMEQAIYLTENDDDLQSAGSDVGVETQCDPYEPESSQGNRRFVWIDGPGEQSGELGPGDRFRIEFDECFNDRDVLTAGTLYRDGTLPLDDYFENRSPFGIGWFDTRFDALRSLRVDKEQGNPVPGAEITADSFGITENAVDPAIGFQFILSADDSTIINAGNAFEIADAAINGLSLPRTIGQVVLDLLIAAVLDPGVDDFCTAGGAHVVDPLPTGDDAPAPGKDYAIDFDACVLDDGEAQVLLDGALTLAIDSLSGTLDSPGVYTIAITIDPISLTISSEGEASTLSGAAQYSRDSAPPMLTESSTNVPDKQLSIAELSFVNLLGPYTIASSVNSTTDAFTIGASGNSVHVNRSDIPGVLTVTVEQAIAGDGDNPPASGRVLITAEDASKLRLIIEDGEVTLDLDIDGDGTVDDTLGPVPWDEFDT